MRDQLNPAIMAVPAGAASRFMQGWGTKLNFGSKPEGLKSGSLFVTALDGAGPALCGQEKFRSVASNDVQRAARRADASQKANAARYPASELSRHKALTQLRGLQAG